MTSMERVLALLDGRRADCLPALPITPYLLPLPLPVHCHIHFGEPLRFAGSPDDDDTELERKAGVVQAAVQALVDRGLAERPGVFT